MRAMLSGWLLVVLLWPVTTAAGGAESSYGLGEPEPLASDGVALETPVVIVAEPTPPMPPPAAPNVVASQPFRIRLAGAPAPVGREATPLISGLRYQPSTLPR